MGIRVRRLQAPNNRRTLFEIESVSAVLSWLAVSAVFSAGFPIWKAWRWGQPTSLRDTLIWSWSAWLAWLVVAIGGAVGSAAVPPLHVATCLTACAGVGVLGARRRGMTAWNFVLLGLLAVLMLPLLEQAWGAPHWHLDTPRAVFLAGILAVSTVNFIPCTWGVAAGVMGGALGGLAWLLADVEFRSVNRDWVQPLCLAAMAGAAWLAWWRLRRHGRGGGGLNRLWKQFRDCYGLVWGLRILDQFNQAAKNSALPLRLSWRGQEPGTSAEQSVAAEAMRLLLATLRPFLCTDASDLDH